MARLVAYHWPGNVRELIHVIHRAAALASGELTRSGDNRSEAARQLGIGRPQLYAKIEEYGLDDAG